MSVSHSMSNLISRRGVRAPVRRDFGRGRAVAFAVPMPTEPALADDAKLFLSSFVGGLVFMMVYLA